MKLGISSKGSGISQIATAGALCALRENGIIPNLAVATGLFSYIVALFSTYTKDEDIIKHLCEIKRPILKLSRGKRIGFILFPKLTTRDMLYKNIKRALPKKDRFSSLDIDLAITAVDVLSSQLYIYSAKKISAPQNAVVTDENLHKAIRYSQGGCGAVLPFFDGGRYMASSSACMLSQGALLSSMGADKTIEIEIISRDEERTSLLSLCESKLQKQDKWKADYKLIIDVSDIDITDKNVVSLLFERGKEKTQEMIGDLVFSLYI